MVLPLNHSSSNQQQSQPNSLLLLLCLPILQDLTAFLTKLIEEDQLIRKRRQKQAETEKLSQPEIEAKNCNRLIAIILKHTERKGISSSELPYLKRKSYNELCAYINRYWPELSNRI